jgi:O-antigen/teichoic acid export membrane protein
MTSVRDVLRHVGIYATGLIFARAFSVLLLPLYTRYLDPRDFGVIAILDLSSSLLATIGGLGLGFAAARLHFDATSERERDELWWTAALVTLAVGGSLVAGLLVVRRPAAALLLGADIANGGYFLALAFVTLVGGFLEQFGTGYAMVEKRSTLVTTLSITRTVVNATLNVTALVYLDLGVAGLLWGNLITTVLFAAVAFFVLVRFRGWPRLNWHYLPALSRLGSPLVPYILLSTLMHSADRYLLRAQANLHEVGIYSVVYLVGQGVNALVTSPFNGVWSVLIYDIARTSSARHTFARAFEQYFRIVAIVMLGVSLFSTPLLATIAAPQYLSGARLLPVVCLAYLFFSLHDHFKVPALLHRQTTSLVPAAAAAALANVVLNIVFIPRWGATAAAWTSVVTFFIFSGVGLVFYRRLERYPYPFARCGVVLVGMTATLAAQWTLEASIGPGLGTVTFSSIAWLAWAGWAIRGAIKDSMLWGWHFSPVAHGTPESERIANDDVTSVESRPR